MKKRTYRGLIAFTLCAAALTGVSQRAEAADNGGSDEYVFHGAGNPYLPLWEHLPDGEPRVFEDPDNPGKYRAYIIGSHDVRFGSYCGPDIHMWSAPFEDLSQWRDEGPIFTYNIQNQWDVMYAPDLVEVNYADGKRKYILYPHSRGANREPLVAIGDRPDGPFTPLNASEDGTRTLPGSCIGFDPSVFIEKVTDKNDPDYKIGFRAYGYWGFQHSTAAQLDQNTMYSVRPGTERIEFFLPASASYGRVRDPEGTKYPALAEGQNPGEFNFFEASSIRQVGNKYVMIFSGYSGPDYGLGSTNSALRYCYADSPLGPWRSGGVAVDSRGVVPSEDGSKLITTNSAHNTHGSIQLINDQWYIFYHRPPRGFGNARQAMVAPIKIEWDEKPVSEGGKVVLRGYDPFAADGVWTAKAKDGTEYTGAEVTSEGFFIYGLPPYQYYSAGYACFMSDPGMMQDTWDNWDNNMDLTNVKNGAIIGFKYFGFEGLKKASKGIKPFEGTKKGNKTKLNLFLTPRTDQAFKIIVMMDGPWANDTWNGKKIGELSVNAGSANVSTKFLVDVAQSVEGLKGKHAIYLVAEGPEGELFDLHGIGFSSQKVSLSRHISPKVTITLNGEVMALEDTPVRSTNQNGFVNVENYVINKTVAAGDEIKAYTSNPEVAIEVVRSADAPAKVICTYRGQRKIYNFDPSLIPAPQPRRFGRPQ